MRSRIIVPAAVVALLAACVLGVTAAQQRPRAGGAAPSFSTRAELVVLDVTVTDRFHAYVAGLERSAFKVLEDGQPQQIELFSQVDSPVTVGLIIDNSASMYGTRDLVAAAAGAFASTSNRTDEIFALTFNDVVQPVLPATMPFTSDPDTLRLALASAITSRGRTAFHDAVLRGIARVNEGQHPRKVLIVVSDGGDNASVATFDDVVRRSEASNTTIYTIVIEDRLDTDGRPARLKQLAAASGGQAFQPATAAKVQEALTAIARDIRNTYTVGYAPANNGADGRFRRIQVLAHASDGESLHVRTREGYVVERR